MFKKRTKVEDQENLEETSQELTSEEAEILKIRDEANQRIQALKDQGRTARVPQQIQSAIAALTRLAADPKNVTMITIMVKTAEVKTYRNINSVL